METSMPSIEVPLMTPMAFDDGRCDIDLLRTLDRLRDHTTCRRAGPEWYKIGP